MNELSDLVFQQRLLEGVSRSFAFTIPELPEALRHIVTNAYLLFRVADTIEDENALTIDQKQTFWGELIAAVSESGDPEKLVNDLLPLLSSSTSPAERELIRNLNHIIRITRGFNEQEREALKRCLRLMCTGMEWFQKHRSPQGVRNLAELNDYCYYVAGVVGELLTDLFYDYLVETSQTRATLKKLAISFGQGLQMTNILKDLWEDQNRGVCWLPRDVFKETGFDLARLPRKRYDLGFGRGLSALIAIAHGHLKNGLTYTLFLPKSEEGLRKFCLWAIGMAILTLRNINRKKDFTAGEEVKISRRKVKGIMLATRFAGRSNVLLKTLFFLSARGLPDKSFNRYSPFFFS